MKKLLLPAIICLFAQLNYAQQSEMDSLRSLLAKNTAADSNRVLLLIRIAKAMVYSSPDSMMRYADEALGLSNKIGWQQGIARSLQLKGVAYSYGMNDQVSALYYYHQTLDANKNPTNKPLEFGTIANIAVIFYNQRQLDESLKYYKQALSILDEIDNKNGEEQLLLNIANVYYDKHAYDTAKLYFAKSLDLAQKKNNVLITMGALNALGTFYMHAQDYAKAQTYIERSLLLSNQTGNLLVKANCLVNMALAKLRTNKPDSAEVYAKEAVAVAQDASSMQFRREAWEALSMIYEKKKQYDKAFEAGKNYDVLNDSLLSDESKQEVSRLQLQYEFDKKEALLKSEHDKKQALAAAEISRQKVVRNSVAGGAAVLLLASIISFIFYKRRRDAEQQQKEAEFSAQVSDTEMKALRAQMNPHFIFNSLNSISDYISKNNLQAADNYLTKFAKLMRSILENSEQREVPLSEDLQSLELYMQLESLRLNNKFTYEIKVDDSIDKENTLIPPLILQPFVENSIWHGIAKKDGEGKISVEIKKDGAMINCIVEDNGIGRERSSAIQEQKRNAFKKSLGMKITKSRIDIINKIKKSNASVELSDLAEGMRAKVRLPLQLSF